MRDTPFALPFHDDDLRLLSIEDVSQQLRVSRAFVRLCLEAGCPTRNGLLSAAEVLHRLFEHYADVREIAGLAPFAPLDRSSKTPVARMKMANALFTLVEFGESRSPSLAQKRQFRAVRRTIERAI